MSEAKIFTKDPTCGMDVDEATALHEDRDGKTYYFCREPCQKKFLAVSAGTAETGTELFVSDGTAIGTSLLADIAPGAASSTPHDFSVARDRVFFVAYDPEHGEELWSTDGTPSGTRLVQDIAPGAASSLPQGLMAAPRFLFLTADDGTIGREPWIVPLPCVPPLPAFGTRSTPCPVSGDGGGIPGPIKR
jgi:ELWxxDGT repeat protein